VTDAQIIDGIERREGWPTFTNHPEDFGGPTKGGITLATLRLWRNNPHVTVDELKALERPEARAIYQFLFLQPFAGVPDQKLREYLIDLGVLRGPRAAALMLQDVVGARPADGWIGPKTLKALEPLSRHALVMVIGARFQHIEQRVRTVPSQETFRNGWRNRNRSFLP
jgi:lysozyme family protein